MMGLFRPRRVAMIALLTFAWCALWGAFSVANVVGGLVLSALVTTRVVGTPTTGGVALVPLLKLAGVVASDLAKSTVAVAVEILTPTDRTNEAIVAVDPPFECRDHMLFLVVAITLTPGTAVIDVDREQGRLYLHVLHWESVDETIAHVGTLARLVGEALPVRSEADA